MIFYPDMKYFYITFYIKKSEENPNLEINEENSKNKHEINKQKLTHSAEWGSYRKNQNDGDRVNELFSIFCISAHGIRLVIQVFSKIVRLASKRAAVQVSECLGECDQVGAYGDLNRKNDENVVDPRRPIAENELDSGCELEAFCDSVDCCLVDSIWLVFWIRRNQVNFIFF